MGVEAYDREVIAPKGEAERTHDGAYFFQAEDGIRDRTVTGVQTCALPISISLPATAVPRASTCCTRCAGTPLACRPKMQRSPAKIGRASCRERVYISAVAGWLKENNEPGRLDLGDVSATARAAARLLRISW